MLADRRQEEILRLLTQSGSLTLRDIVDELQVSEATARRDVTQLAAAGRLTRVYGGVLANGIEELSFALSDTTDRAEKRDIARAAAALVHDGDTVILDIGSTVLELARMLAGRPITVITGNLMAYEAMKERVTTELILLGGAVRRNYWATSGHLTAQALQGMHADIVFLGTSGITPRGQVLDSTSDDVAVKQHSIAAADRSVLLATERKFPGGGRHVVCNVSDFSSVITSMRVAETTIAPLRALGAEIVRAETSAGRAPR